MASTITLSREEELEEYGTPREKKDEGNTYPIFASLRAKINIKKKLNFSPKAPRAKLADGSSRNRRTGEFSW